MRYGSPIHVYRNITTQRWTVVNTKKRVKIASPEALFLHNIIWKIQPGGQRKVRETGVKNVHAYAGGLTWGEVSPIGPLAIKSLWKEVWYNPFRTDQFVWRDDCAPVYTVPYAYFSPMGSVWAPRPISSPVWGRDLIIR